MNQSGQTDANRARNEEEIRKLLQDRARALRDKDADLAVAHLADDAVSFALAPPLQFAGAAARDKARMSAWFETWQGPIAWELRELVIEAGDEIAFARALGHMTGKKTDGENVDLWTRATMCFKRSGGTWKIVHEHTSVPFYMDGSFKAAIDLKP